MSDEAWHEFRMMENDESNLAARGPVVNREMGAVNKRIASGTMKLEVETAR